MVDKYSNGLIFVDIYEIMIEYVINYHNLIYMVILYSYLPLFWWIIVIFMGFIDRAELIIFFKINTYLNQSEWWFSYILLQQVMEGEAKDNEYSHETNDMLRDSNDTPYSSIDVGADMRI
jgi:hypothetical protein